MMETGFTPVVKAPFNMAIASLERISDILREITKNSIEKGISRSERQYIKVELVKNLCFNAFPLLKESFEKQTTEEAIKLQPRTREVIKKSADEYTNTNNATIIFSKELEDTLDRLIIKISRELQKENYLMPPKEDHGSAITGM